MRRLSWILTAPLMLVGVVFAVVNRQLVEVSLWPLPVTVEMPLFLIVLGALFGGFLVGGLSAWLAGGGRRREARREHRRAATLESEVTRMKRSEPGAGKAALPGPGTNAGRAA